MIFRSAEVCKTIEVSAHDLGISKAYIYFIIVTTNVGLVESGIKDDPIFINEDLFSSRSYFQISKQSLHPTLHRLEMITKMIHTLF